MQSCIHERDGRKIITPDWTNNEFTIDPQTNMPMVDKGYFWEIQKHSQNFDEYGVNRILLTLCTEKSDSFLGLRKTRKNVVSTQWIEAPYSDTEEMIQNKIIISACSILDLIEDRKNLSSNFDTSTYLNLQTFEYSGIKREEYIPVKGFVMEDHWAILDGKRYFWSSSLWKIFEWDGETNLPLITSNDYFWDVSVKRDWRTRTAKAYVTLCKTTPRKYWTNKTSHLTRVSVNIPPSNSVDNAVVHSACTILNDWGNRMGNHFALQEIDGRYPPQSLKTS